MAHLFEMKRLLTKSKNNFIECFSDNIKIPLFKIHRDNRKLKVNKNKQHHQYTEKPNQLDYFRSLCGFYALQKILHSFKNIVNRNPQTSSMILPILHLIKPKHIILLTMQFMVWCMMKMISNVQEC